MSQLNIKVHMMTGGPIGDVASLPNPATALKISTRSEGWFRVYLYGANESRIAPGASGAQVAAPVVTPAPAAGAAAASGWFYLKANESRALPPALNGAFYQDVEIWEIGTAEVDIDGTDPGWGR